MTLNQLVTLAGTDFSKKEVRQIFAKIYNCKDTFEETKLNWLLSIWKELAIRFEMPSSTQAEKDVIRDVFVFASKDNIIPKNLRQIVEECCEKMSFGELEKQLATVSHFNIDNMTELYNRIYE